MCKSCNIWCHVCHNKIKLKRKKQRVVPVTRRDAGDAVGAVLFSSKLYDNAVMKNATRALGIRMVSFYHFLSLFGLF